MANYEGQHQETMHVQSLQSVAEADRRTLTRLRHTILQLNKIIGDHCSGNVPVDVAKNNFTRIARLIETDFEILERDAGKMVQVNLNTPEMNRLHTLLLGAACDPFQSEVYNSALKVSNSGPAVLNYVDLAYEFMRSYVGTPPSRSLRKEHATLTPEAMLASQRNLEQFLKSNIANFGATTKRLKAVCRLLEQNPLTSVMEICLYLCNEKGGQVIHSKVAAVLNNGIIEHILVIAPSEEWSYRPENNKIVDVSVSSKYEFYKRYSAAVNMSTPMEPRALLTVLHYMFRAPAFMQPCGHCKKFLHNFAPAYADCRDKRFLPYHESCR